MKLNLLLLLAAILGTLNTSFAATTAGRPQIAAAEVTSRTTNSATFLIGINANVAQTTVTIQYNTSGNFFDPLQTAQVGVTSGMVNYTPTITGLQPNTTYYFRVRASNFYGDSYSGTFNTKTFSDLPPTISNITVNNIGDNKATLSFGITTSNGAVKYDILVNTNGNFLGQDIGTNVPTTNGGTISKLITGLLPNTLYYYKIIAKSGPNSERRTDSSIQNFTTAAVRPPALIAEFKFDNSYNSEANNLSFSSNAGTSFTTDRNENATGAIRIVNTGSTATIPNLPYGNTDRSVSLWAKANSMRADYNMLFSYGAGSASSSFGGGFNAAQAIALGYNNNYHAATTNTANTWYHFVFTYNSITTNVYKNGALLGGLDRNWNTLSNADLFKIGVGVGGELWFDGAIDDLKIFDKELSAAQVLSLYQNNVLTSTKNIRNNNLNINIHPNTVSDKVVFENVSETTQKAVYNLQGVRVLESHENSIAVSHLPAGIYIVKFSLADNAVGYGRFIKK